MDILLLTHPDFVDSKSMPRYAKYLSDGLSKRGHNVLTLTAQPFFSKIPSPKGIKKWLGYIDQFILFPIIFKLNYSKKYKNFFYVVTDHALGIWIPLVRKKPHAIHCHDFIAQNSALGRITENSINRSGKIYQKLIRRGYVKGDYFIGISLKTQQDLHRFLKFLPRVSAVIYNGFNQEFKPSQNIIQTNSSLSKKLGVNLEKGFILNVGGNQFYKNRIGVIEIYSEWRSRKKSKIPLLLIGAKPTEKLQSKRNESPFRNEIHFLIDVDNSMLKEAYKGASLFLFPSITEGFGWPIAEAMASGCPVITTGEAPMNEVGGDAAFYISKKPSNENDLVEWYEEGAGLIEKILNMTDGERAETINRGLENAKRFDTEKCMSKIENVYKEIFELHSK